MDNGVIAWLIVFAISALVFFGVAVVVSVKGFTDLLTLLRHTSRRDENGPAPKVGENI
jgi:hypothetical protein